MELKQSFISIRTTYYSLSKMQQGLDYLPSLLLNHALDIFHHVLREDKQDI